MSAVRSGTRWAQRESGFTLVELVAVIVIAAVLAAFAIPKIISLDSSARIATVKSLAATLKMSAEQAYGACMASNIYSGCTVSSGSWLGTINGQTYQLSMGYPDAGDDLNYGEIDVFVNYSGFTAQLTDWQTTTFVLSSAPVPANCSVAYVQANYFGSWTPTVTTTTTGC